MCMNILAAFLYVHYNYTCCHWRSEEGTDPLELELQMGLSHLVSTGYQIRVFCKKSKCSQLLSHFCSPHLFLLKERIRSKNSPQFKNFPSRIDSLVPEQLGREHNGHSC